MTVLGASSAFLGRPLLDRGTPPSGLQGSQTFLQRTVHAAYSFARDGFLATTDAAFIRSEVNGRQSRRVVLCAFFCTDAIGAMLWACWCEMRWSVSATADGTRLADQERACGSFGMNHFLLLFLGLPVEGAVLFTAGQNPWSFWSDGLLLPVWLIRLGLFDVLLWSVSPQMLLGDALWFSVMAVMCRVHSLALLILVGSQVVSLCIALSWRRELESDSSDGFDFVRYGIYSVTMLVIMAGAYILDEQSRLQSFEQLMSLQDQNAVLAERLLRWKVIPSETVGHAGADAVRPPAAAHLASSTDDLGWRHVVMEDPEDFRAASTSSCSGVGGRPSPAAAAAVARAVEPRGALPLPAAMGAALQRVRGAGWDAPLRDMRVVHSIGGVRSALPGLPQAPSSGRASVPTHRPRMPNKQAWPRGAETAPLSVFDAIE